MGAIDAKADSDTPLDQLLADAVMRWRKLVLAQGLWQSALEVGGPALIAGVGRSPFGRFVGIAFGLAETIPEARCFRGIVTGFGHQLDTDGIGFALMVAAVRQQDAILGTGAKGLHG